MTTEETIIQSGIRSKRVAIIMFTLFPWNIPLFNRLIQDNNVDFHFFFSLIRTKRRVWKSKENSLPFNYTILKTIAINNKQEKFVSIDILPKLWKFNPDIIIGYGFGLTILQSLVYALLNKKKMIIWGEMPLQLEKKRSIVLRLYRKCFAHACAGGLASSSQTMDFYRSIDIKRMFLAPLTVDGAKIDAVPKEKYFGKKDPVKILYVGSIEHRKGIDLLLDTFEKVQRLINVKITIRIVGNTNIEPEYINKLAIYRSNPAIEIQGFTDDIAKDYMEADLFAMFTRRDAHAMVIPEAMSYGLPIICSKFAGCVDDFIKDNGFILDPHNVNENAKLIGQLLLNPSRLLDMANASLRIIRETSNKQSAETIIGMIRGL